MLRRWVHKQDFKTDSRENQAARSYRTYAGYSSVKPLTPWGASNANAYSSWIGKYLVFQDAKIPDIPDKYLLYETDVMRKAGRYIYRIGYISNPNEDTGTIFTEPYRPGQLNILLDNKNRVVSVQYF